MKVYVSKLPKTSKPIIDYCRKLLEEGKDPNTKLEIYRKGNPDPDVFVHNIGLASKLMISDSKFKIDREYAKKMAL